MSDRMQDPTSLDGLDAPDGLQAWVAGELRRPIALNPAARGRVMALVRAARPPMRRRRPPGRGARAGWASPLVGAALAAGVCGAMALGARWPAQLARTEPGASAAAVVVLGDTVASTLRDTVRLVRFMLVAPAASRVALAGDFNRWSATATPLAAGPGGVWRGAVSLAPGQHHYAFIVDDTGWVADPAGARAEGVGRRAHSVVTVPGTSN